MKPNIKRNIAIVFGKDEGESFNRYTFPILGRPAATYPILAALNASKIDGVYLSSDSIGLINLARNFKDVRLLERKKSQPTLTEEVRLATNLAVADIGAPPETVTILLANSPCVETANIDEAITFLEKNEEYDSVATAMNRAEFNPMRIFSLNGQDDLVKSENDEKYKDNVYFLDRRLMVVRTNVLLKSTINNDYFEGLLGKKIHPIIQKDGIWDIDYIWQVPIVERWLRQNGFNDSETPYDRDKANPSLHISQFRTSDESPGRNHGSFKILVTTVPFGEVDETPIKLMNQIPNLEYVINPIGRKLTEAELAELVRDFDIIIAGTEPITRKVMEHGPRLKLISRVGIGLDSVDLRAARDLDIKVAYTPDAPSAAVAELTIAQMINMLRRVPLIDRKLRSGIWQRIHGERLANMTVGIIGTGRVGSRVLRHLQGFGPRQILVNDLKPDANLYEMYHAKFVDKETIYRQADIITLHIPLTSITYGLIGRSQLEMMKKNVCLINTSRGGIINENDLYESLSRGAISAAAIDVFEREPYSGNLVELDNCYLTCHMGSMTNDCRAAMEILATQEAIRFVQGEELKGQVPDDEYENQLQR